MPDEIWGAPWKMKGGDCGGASAGIVVLVLTCSGPRAIASTSDGPIEGYEMGQVKRWAAASLACATNRFTVALGLTGYGYDWRARRLRVAWMRWQV